MNKYYSDGIKKIVDLYNGDIKTTVNKMKKIVQASEDYTSFSQKRSGTNGTVKFLYRTDAIGD
ncbi:MAG: hypothetical protein VB031_01205 [Eubacteriaceae bacterium]|nr:hypothetical protein [Eubacteriaceae bacterium]